MSNLSFQQLTFKHIRIYRNSWNKKEILTNCEIIQQTTLKHIKHRTTYNTHYAMATNRHALRLQTLQTMSLLLVDSKWRHIRAGSSICCTCAMNGISDTVLIRMFEAEFLEGSGRSKYGRVQISYPVYMIIIIKTPILIIYASKLHLKSHISWSDFKILCP
jgi:hypothetical protein